MSWRTSLKEIESKCDGSNHGKYSAPCSHFECADCGGKLCQKSSLHTFTKGGFDNGFVCAKCADNYEMEETVSSDGLAAGYCPAG